jgi:Tfp pilus assembly protein PilZ
MQILKVRYRTNREFLDAYQGDLPGGGLFCPTTTPLSAGGDVICELTIPALPNKVLIRGQVKSWRPALPRLRVRAGAVVEFIAEEAEKRNFVVETVRGLREPGPRRKHTRLPVELPVQWRILGTADYSSGGLSEISVGGALLRTGSLLPLGTEIIIEVTPPGAVSPIAISGKVAYHAPNNSSGVKFQYRDGGGSRRLRELIRRLRMA